MATFTRKGSTTRQRIIEGAAAEIRERGIAAFRLDDVLTRTRTSKSQLFHYFPAGKEELLLAVAQLEADRVLTDQQPMLGDLASWPAWQAWRDQVVARYLAQGQECPLQTLFSQIGGRTPGARAVVTELMQQWQSEITAGIRRMQDAGEMRADVDADRAGAALLAGIQGGVVVMLSTGDIGHLEAALDVGIDNLRADGAAGRPVAH
ncbi:TetR/AcrR family transcriptional regulator [Micromonospora krabiensis]|uniref:Transcriptional regulator, TetR family n=1 Tax=Micromonospora krabiensis TaxID=307121 RepID=A0A1C3MYH6_9ACTN|nr:TetR/AcrR family transcriptional regulator [Micromonospora krabiensis]SBV25371.1 transcriptional regulator, TetR family [Micromonospora krabiensis]